MAKSDKQRFFDPRHRAKAGGLKQEAGCKNAFVAVWNGPGQYAWENAIPRPQLNAGWELPA